jgi:hypothetical protein
MELLAEILLWVGQLLLEVLLQLLFEILAELGLWAAKKTLRSAGPVRPVLVLVGYLLLGGALGGISLVFFPQKFAVPMWLQIANIAISPVVVGVAMVWVGQRRSLRGQQAILLHKFWFGFAFALVFALVRFRFAA